jgi:hypothetical protein
MPDTLIPCEKHELTGCADCAPGASPGIPRQARLRSRAAGSGLGPWFPAQYDGGCGGCGEKITEGDSIRADGCGGWLCPDCGAESEYVPGSAVIPPRPGPAVRVMPAEPAEHLLAMIWLYVDWRSVTRRLTAEQRELWADALEAHSRKVALPGETPAKADRWWRQ